MTTIINKKITKMKKITTALLVLTMVLTACDTEDDNDGNPTTLTITNMNFLGYLGYPEFAYGSVDFGLIGNSHTQADSESITKNVTAGTRYVYITDHVYTTNTELKEGVDLNKHNQCICPVFRTNSVTCEEGENNQFSITNNTIVTFIDGYGYNSSDEITGTIKAISDNVTDNYFEYLIGQGLID